MTEMTAICFIRYFSVICIPSIFQLFIITRIYTHFGKFLERRIIILLLIILFIITALFSLSVSLY